jgi:hypothetical protein
VSRYRCGVTMRLVREVRSTMVEGFGRKVGEAVLRQVSVGRQLFG